MSLKTGRTRWQAFKKLNPDYVKAPRPKLDLGPTLDQAAKLRDEIIRSDLQLHEAWGKLDQLTKKVADDIADYVEVEESPPAALVAFRNELANRVGIQQELSAYKADYLRHLKEA